MQSISKGSSKEEEEEEEEEQELPLGEEMGLGPGLYSGICHLALEEEEQELPLEEEMGLGPGYLHRQTEHRRAHGCGGAMVRGGGQDR